MKRASELSEGEELILMARSRWTSYILPAAVLAGYGAVWYMARRTGEDTLTFHVLMAAIGVWAVRFFARRLATYLMLTNKRVYGEAGVLVTKTLDVPLNQVGGVYVEKTPIGRITGRGTVTITTAGSQFEFPYIPGAGKFRDALVRQLELAEAEAARVQTEAMAEAIARAIRRTGTIRRHNRFGMN